VRHHHGVRRRGAVLLVVLGLVLAVAGGWLLVRADDALVRERTTVDGVPVLVTRPPGSGPFPAVVVAHGFSGSGRLMDGLALGLAREGFLAVTLDFRGHGRNATPLGETGDGGLEDDLAVVTAWTAARPDVAISPGAVALLGHSMGAGAVTRFALGSPGTQGPVVALSLPDAGELPPAPEAPATLLLVGDLEPARFGEAVDAAAELGYATGTVAGAEHLTILFRSETLARSAGWLEAPGGPPADVAPDQRLAGVGLVGLGASLVVWGLAPLVLTRHRRTVPPGIGRTVSRLGLVLAASLVAVLVLRVVPAVGEAVPLLVGGWLVACFGMVGALLLLVARPFGGLAVASLPGVLLLALVAFAGVALPAQLGWAELSVVGVRAWALPLAVLALLLFSWGEAALLLHPQPAGTARLVGRVLLARALLLAVLVAAVLVLDAPGFLLLILPLVGILLLWFGALGARVLAVSRAPLAAALVQAPALAALVGAASPIA
jgi:dienelactone hydrolase